MQEPHICVSYTPQIVSPSQEDSTCEHHLRQDGFLNPTE